MFAFVSCATYSDAALVANYLSSPITLDQVLDSVKAARDKLPPHDVWLKHMVGMADYSKR